MSQYTLRQLALQLNAELKGDGDTIIHGVAPLDSAKSGEISFLDNKSYRKLLPETKASAVILSAEYSEKCPSNHLIVKNPYYAYAQIAGLFQRPSGAKPGRHPSSIIDPSAMVAASATIGPHVVIGPDSTIGDAVIIEANSVIGARCLVGAHSRIWSNVTIYDDVKIGERCRIHSGAVIGADGFGLAKHENRWHDVPQLGGVTIGNDVLIGANTTIDCGAILDTIIEDGVKLDNQIQIGHNVKIGAHTAIAGCTGIAGSTKIGAHCTIGGGVGIAGHIEIVDHVTITATSAVSGPLTNPGVYMSGFRAKPYTEWVRIVAHVEKIEKLVNRLKYLEEQSDQS